MEQYPVPQFIEQEGRIAVFLSFRQFFYLVGGGAACLILYYLLPFFFFIILALPIAISVIALAFISVNGEPLLNFIFGSVGFLFRSKNYVWTKKESPYPFKPIKSASLRIVEEASSLQAQSGSLKKIKNQIETKKTDTPMVNIK